MTNQHTFGKRRAGSAPSAKPAIQSGNRRGFFAAALALYRSDSTFRGVLDFAAIGALVLLFLNPGSFARVLAPFGNAAPGFATSAASTITELSGDKLPRPPKPSDLQVNTRVFSSSSMSDQPKLKAAAAAYKKRDAATVLTLLADATQDDPNVMLMRGLATMALPGGENVRAGALLLDQAAAAGQLQAMTFLGIMNVVALPGLSGDQARGREMLDKAAKLGDRDAAYMLAVGYQSGWAGTVDLARSVQYLEIAARHRHPAASMLLSYYYAKGVGVKADGARAEELLRQAAESGDRDAEHLLGKHYLVRWASGWMPTPDEAIHWLTKAANRGHPRAMFDLGTLHITFAKEPPLHDPARAAAYFKRCAHLLDDSCAFTYGALLEGGIGVSQDLVAALAYFEVSLRFAKTDIESVKRRIARVETMLAPEQIRTARARASTLAAARPRNS